MPQHSFSPASGVRPFSFYIRCADFTTGSEADLCL